MSSLVFTYIIFAVIVFVLLNIAWSTIRLGISPTPSTWPMRNTCATLLHNISTTHPYKTLVIAGSGWGGLAFFLSQQQKSPIICYEAAFIPWLCSKYQLKIRQLWHPQAAPITLIRANIHQMNLPQHSLVVCYLYPQGTQELYQTLSPYKNTCIGFISIAFAVNNQIPAIVLNANDWFKTPLYWYKFRASKPSDTHE